MEVSSMTFSKRVSIEPEKHTFPLPPGTMWITSQIFCSLSEPCLLTYPSPPISKHLLPAAHSSLISIKTDLSDRMSESSFRNLPSLLPIALIPRLPAPACSWLGSSSNANASLGMLCNSTNPQERALDRISCSPVSLRFQVISEFLKFLLIHIGVPQAFCCFFLMFPRNIPKDRASCMDLVHPPGCTEEGSFSCLLDALTILNDQLDLGESSFFQSLERPPPKFFISAVSDLYPQGFPVPIFSYPDDS